ncbi:MAG: hypothetical protein O2820_26440 [Planctomycetota bacterium]|nr:hypothetical protein [Planctomycetota bacterium]
MSASESGCRFGDDGGRLLSCALPDDPDTEYDGRVGVFSWLSQEVSTRSVDGSRPVICLMDGEHKLWARKRELLPENVVEVLDLWHVMDRLWDVALALHGSGKAASRDFVSTRLSQILAGNVGRVTGGLRQTLTKRRLPKAVYPEPPAYVLWLSGIEAGAVSEPPIRSKTRSPRSGADSERGCEWIQWCSHSTLSEIQSSPKLRSSPCRWLSL